MNPGPARVLEALRTTRRGKLSGAALSASLGVTRAQVWRMVLVESSTMAVVAFVLSIPLGFLLTWVVTTGTREAFGFTFPTLYPWTWIPVVAAFGSVVATLAAFAPGRRAASLQVVGALQYE